MGVSPKVAAGFGGAGGSTPVSVIAIWLIGLSGVAIPPEVSAAIAAAIAMVASGLAGWLVPHSPDVAAFLAAQADAPQPASQSGAHS